MKQYVSQRRRCLTHLTQMDPVIHLSEGHRSDMLLDLSGLTREERVMVQASINIERDFERVADDLIIQHPRIHFRESRKRAKGRQRRNQTWRPQTFVGFRRKVNTLGVKNLEQVPIMQTSRPLKITVMMTTRSNQQMVIKHTTTLVTLEVTLEKKLWTAMATRKTICFLHMLLWMTSLFSRQLNCMQLLFLPTRGTTILTQKLAHSCYKPSKGKGKGKFPVRPSCLLLEDRRQRLRKLKAKTECRVCGRKRH